MNRCPGCGATGGLTLAPVMVAKPAGSYSLAGAQDKTAAVDAARLSCPACGWSAIGRIENLQVAGDGTITGGHLIIDQPRPAATSPAGQTPSYEDRPRQFWSDALGRARHHPRPRGRPAMTGPASIAVEPVTTPYVGLAYLPEAGGLR